MTDRTGSAFLLSATLHAIAIEVFLLLSFVAHQSTENLPRVLELVAGEGDNYGAKVAPALGTPDGVKLDLATPPTPKAEPFKAPPEPPKAEPVKAPPEPPKPVPVAPATPAPVKAADAPTVPNFKQQIQRKIIRAESKAKMEVAKERAAEAKRLAEEQKKMTKEEFDRANKKTGSARAPKVDAEGIAKGVVGGSTENKKGGAGGKALVSNNDDALAGYFSLFKQRLTQAFELPPGLSDTLVAVVRVQNNADGSLTGARIIKSSGSADFDRAVLEAVRRIQLPARPDHRSEPIEFPFTLRERGDL